MPLSEDKINSLKSTISQKENPIDSIQQNITSAVSDPFGTAITKALSKVNSLTVNIETKIDKLLQDVVKATDGKGRVSLEGNNLVITVSPDDVTKGKALQTKVENNIKSIQKTLTVLTSTLKALNTIQTAISTVQTALTIQEAILSLNPTSGPIFQVFKKAIKIVFLKEMVSQYSKILKSQIQQNTRILDSLSSRFKNIQVSIKIGSEANAGNYIDKNQAENMIIQDLLNQNSDTDINRITEDYTDFSGFKYILKVEKYGDKQLVARAYEQESGMIKEETAPSFFSTPDQLLEELKNILNLNQ